MRIFNFITAYMKQKEKDQLVMEETAREMALINPVLS